MLAEDIKELNALLEDFLGHIQDCGRAECEFCLNRHRKVSKLKALGLNAHSLLTLLSLRNLAARVQV